MLRCFSMQYLHKEVTFILPSLCVGILSSLCVDILPSQYVAILPSLCVGIPMCRYATISMCRYTYYDLYVRVRISFLTMEQNKRFLSNHVVMYSKTPPIPTHTHARTYLLISAMTCKNSTTRI